MAGMGIADSLIAAILYETGRKTWTLLNDPLANAIDRTITYFHKERGIEISRDRFAALLEGRIGEKEISRFRDGDRFIDGDKLALQFAIFGGLYFEDESQILKVATEILAYFKDALTKELLKDPRRSIETLASMQSIFHKQSQADHERILNAIESIAANLKAHEEKQKRGRWPGVSVGLSGPKVLGSFAGRVAELGRLSEAMGGEKKVAAVVGLAGQGKSCLAGEWYRRGARPPDGVGLFWRKVYEAGYTFDRFLDELHEYLTGAPIDRDSLRTVEQRASVVVDLLQNQPCWIVLDGLERWLKRWADDPDAGAEGASDDDRAAREPVLDKFLKGAAFWPNGSRLLLTTRAVPSALDDNPPVRVGRRIESRARLEALRPRDAVALMRKLGVGGDAADMREAVEAYGCHPYAVHVLGVLICDRYERDASRWREVNPVAQGELAGLFEAIVQHRPEDVDLLERIASSVGPAAVQMLAQLSGRDEDGVRRDLARLARWQMAEFEDAGADQHTVVRQFLLARMDAEKVAGLRRQLANWWAGRDVPVHPEALEQVRPLLKAVEHLIAAADPDAATDIFLTKPSPESYYTLGDWLRAYGYLDEGIRIYSDLIGAYRALIDQEGRTELRNDLARCYNNRGLALEAQGQLAEAIADYGRAIEIREALVTQEGRTELRNDLAGCYNNRGGAFQLQGQLGEAIADYGRAIDFYETLVMQEGRTELRGDLENVLFNRAVARSRREQWEQARADIEKGAALLRALIEEGRRHVVGSFLQTVGFRCAFAEKLGDPATAAEWANDAMRFFIEEVEAQGTNVLLLRAAMGFSARVRAARDVLSRAGLDEKRLERFAKLLQQAAEQQDSS